MSSNVYRKCVKCGANAVQYESIRFHRFPKPGTTNILRHFEDSCYIDNCKKRLSRYAVPGTKQYVIKTLHSLKSKISISSIVQQVNFSQDLSISGCSTVPVYQFGRAIDAKSSTLTNFPELPFEEQEALPAECCVPNCKSIRQQVKLHQIPVGSVGESRNLWVKAIVAVAPNITDQIYTEELHKLFICHKHFERRFISEKNRVLINGYPSLFTEEEIASGVPSKVDPEVGTQRILEKCIDVNPDAKDTQIEAAPEIEVEDSGGEAVFSWQREEELIEADPEDPPEPADPTLALFCESEPDPRDPGAPNDPGAPAQRAHAAPDADPGPEFDPDPDIIFNPQPDQAVPSLPAPVDNRCKDCGEVNEGFEFWCVQCAGGALCGACAGRAPHHAHYVLRVPMGYSQARTQVVLTMIRQQLLQNQNLSQHGTVDDDLKLEVKEEPAEVPPAESSAAEPDPLACEPHEPISLDDPLVPEFPHDLIEPLEPVSLHSPRSSSRSPHSPPPSCPASPPEPTVTPEPGTHEADKSIEEIVEYHETLQPPRLRKPTDAHEEILIPTQCKLSSPAELKRAFPSHIERVVTTQNKQLKVYQPLLELTQVRENVVTTQHKEPTYQGSSRTTRLQARGQATMKVTSEPQPSEIVTIDLDVAEETVEYLEEGGLESDIETVDNHGDDVLDEDDLEESDLEEDNLSDEERSVPNVPGRGVKRKKDAEETLPVKGPSESMIRALPSKAVIQVRPLSSLEIRNWTADRKRLRKD